MICFCKVNIGLLIYSSQTLITAYQSFVCCNHRGLCMYLNEVFCNFFSFICVMYLLNSSDVKESWVVFSSSLYTRTVSHLPETLVVIVIEINESFTVFCSAVIWSVFWNTSYMKHSLGKDSHHPTSSSSVTSAGLGWYNCGKESSLLGHVTTMEISFFFFFSPLWNLSFIKCENPASYAVI